MKKILLLLALLPSLAFGTQKTRSAMTTEINSALASGTGITASTLRTVFTDTIDSSILTLTDMPTSDTFYYISASGVISPVSIGAGMTFTAGVLDSVSGGGGTVTSFTAGTLSPLFTTSVATATTTPALTFALSTHTANTVFAGPSSGSAAAPTFRTLVITDLPTSGTLPAYNGSALTALNATQLTTGLVAVARGGTGTATPGIVAGSNITVTGTWPNQTINSTGGGGGGTWGSITGTLSNQTDLQAALDLKAALASPTFTGTPAAPTASPGTNTTQLATTAFVTAAQLTTGSNSIDVGTGDGTTAPFPNFFAIAPAGGTALVTVNGLAQKPTTDYSISGRDLTFVSAPGNGARLQGFSSAPVGGGGSGTVTSVAATVPSDLSITGSPITTSGTLAISYSGTARPVANGGTGATTLTSHGVLIGAGTSAVTATTAGTIGQVLVSNGASADPTFQTVSGTGSVTSVAMSVPSLLSISGSPITTAGTLAVTYSGTALPVANGGSGQTSFTDGQLLIGNSSGNTLSKATLTAGSNVTITNGPGTIMIASSGGGGSGDRVSTLTSAEISITTTATATISRQHVASGTSANYTVTLPAVSGNTDKYLSIRIDPACTRLITVKGNGSEPIDGVNTHVMWANETAEFHCNGTAWTKMAGKSIPMACELRMSTASSTAQLVAYQTMTVVQHDVATSNTSGLAAPMADTSAHTITILRSGFYDVYVVTSVNGDAYNNGVLVTSPWTASRVLGRVFLNPSGANTEKFFGEVSEVLSGDPCFAVVGGGTFSAGDVMNHSTYHNAQAAGNVGVYLVGNNNCQFVVKEVIKW